MKEELLRMKQKIEIMSWLSENVHYDDGNSVELEVIPQKYIELEWIDNIPYINIHIPGDKVLVSINSERSFNVLPSFINFGVISGNFGIYDNYDFKSTRGFPKECDAIYCANYGVVLVLYRPEGFTGHFYNRSSNVSFFEELPNGEKTDGTFEEYLKSKG